MSSNVQAFLSFFTANWQSVVLGSLVYVIISNALPLLRYAAFGIWYAAFSNWVYFKLILDVQFNVLLVKSLIVMHVLSPFFNSQIIIFQ